MRVLTFQDWTANGGSKRWLYMKGDEEDIPWTYASTQERASDAHGEAMFISAVGGKNGVARNANAVMVKWPVYWIPKKGDKLQETHYSAKALLSGLDQIYDDIVAHELEGKAVINMSFCASTPFVYLKPSPLMIIQTSGPAKIPGILDYGTNCLVRYRS